MVSSSLSISAQCSDYIKIAHGTEYVYDVIVKLLRCVKSWVMGSNPASYMTERAISVSKASGTTLQEPTFLGKNF